MSESKENIFLDLGDVYLRALIESDVEGNWYTWFNDEDVTRFQNKRIFPNTREKTRDYFNSLQNSTTDIVLAVVHKETDTHIGNVGIHDMDPVHRRAEIGIVLGEKDFWGKGYGKSCIRAVTEYCFHTLNLHRIAAVVVSGNAGSKKVFETEGFQQEGIMKDYLFKNGEYLDGILLACIREE